MNRRLVPLVVALPNTGVGLLWAMNMSLIPMLAGTFTDSSFQVATLVSMGALTGIFVQYLAGLLSDRSRFKMGRRKPFIIMGTLATAACMAAMPFAPNWTILFGISFLFYVSLNFYQGPYYSLIPESVEPNRLGMANGMAKIVGVLGGGFIFVAGPLLWNVARPLPFLVAAGIGLATVLASFFFLKEDPARYRRPEKVAFDFFRFPSVVKLNLIVFFAFLTLGFISTFFVRYCKNALGIPETDSGVALLTLTLAGAAAAWPLGWLADRFRRQTVLALSATVFLAGLVIAFFARDIGLLFVAMAVVGVGYIGIQINVYALLAELAPPARLGEFTGIMNIFISVSQFGGTLAMGLLLDGIGFAWYFPAAALSMLAACLLAWFSRLEAWKEPDAATQH